MKHYLCVAALAAVLPLSACAMREARVAISPTLASASEKLEVRGMTGSNRGSFDLAGAHGTFARNAERLSLFEPSFLSDRGSGSFRVNQAPGHPELAGRCAYRQAKVGLGMLSTTVQRFAFHCRFARAGRNVDAELVIEDPAGPLGTLHGRSERKGVLHYEGQHLEIRSIHRPEGGGLPTPAPLGYSFRTKGEEIGAVDLNGTNKTIYAPLGEPTREAVIAGALALSILWDPADLQPD